eukprot:66439-Prorocentrum_minimum.AAC.1
MAIGGRTNFSGGRTAEQGPKRTEFSSGRRMDFKRGRNACGITIGQAIGGGTKFSGGRTAEQRPKRTKFSGGRTAEQGVNNGRVDSCRSPAPVRGLGTRRMRRGRPRPCPRTLAGNRRTASRRRAPSRGSASAAAPAGRLASSTCVYPHTRENTREAREKTREAR